MAFKFNSINQALGQQNIFDPDSEMTQQGAPGQQSVFKTSGPTSSVPSPSGGVAPAPGARVQSSYTPNQAAKAYEGVKGTDTTKAVGSIQGNIQGAQDRLQQRANEYGQKAQAEKAKSALDSAQVQGAVLGNEPDLRAVSNRLTQSGAKQLDRFEGLDDKDLPTLTAPIRDERLWGEIFQPEAGANYTTGQSQMENLLLGRSNEFRNIANALARQEDQLIDRNDEMIDSVTKENQEALNADWQAQTDLIRGQLRSGSDQIIADAKAREAAEEERRRGISPWAIQDEIFKTQRPFQEDALRASGLGDWTDLLNDSNAYNGLSKYIRMNGDVDYRDLVTEDEAQRFNRINGLLGGSEMLQAGRGAAPVYSYDAQGGNDYIRSILMGRAKDEEKLREVNAIAEAERQRLAEVEAQKIKDAELKRQLDEEKLRAARMRNEREENQPRGNRRQAWNY